MPPVVLILNRPVQTDQYNEMTHIEVCSVEGLFTRRLLDEESADEVPRVSLTNCLG